MERGSSIIGFADLKKIRIDLLSLKWSRSLQTREPTVESEVRNSLTFGEGGNLPIKILWTQNTLIRIIHQQLSFGSWLKTRNSLCFVTFLQEALVCIKKKKNDWLWVQLNEEVGWGTWGIDYFESRGDPGSFGDKRQFLHAYARAHTHIPQIIYKCW